MTWMMTKRRFPLLDEKREAIGEFHGREQGGKLGCLNRAEEKGLVMKLG